MMNLGFYHPSHNPYGCKRSSDDKYWYNTTVAFNTTADCFNPSKLLTDSGTVASGKSGRNDGRYGDAVYAGGLGGIVDHRLGAVANDSPEEAVKVEAKVENGTYRGLENLVWTKLERETRDVTGTNQIFAPQWLVDLESNPSSLVDWYIVSDAGVIKTSSKTNNNWRSQTSWFYTKGLVLDGVVDLASTDIQVWTYKTNLSVSGEFNTQMVIGDPANILQTDALKDGWLGAWIPVIPDGTEKTFPFTRKCLELSPQAQWTTDKGASWTSVSAWDIDEVTNSRTFSASDGIVYIVPYKAFANQTKPSTAKPVLNATKGLLGVTATQSHDKSVLAEAVAGIILKSDASGIVTEQSQAVKYLVDGTIKRLKTLPTDMVAPTNSSQAIKIAVYQISNNGQASLAVIANTMTHNGTSWGELDEIYIPSSGSESFTDTNGTTQQAICTELSMASGWTSNHARTGPQVAGVDL
ncbi:hypothetical protein VPHD184_0012 [Vibrio phage D184]